MKKPLTKEEFLERKNSEIHKELLSVFKSKSDSHAISTWFMRFSKENPKLWLCQFMGKPKTRLNLNYAYQAAFVNMCEMLKSGELVFKEGKTQVEIDEKYAPILEPMDGDVLVSPKIHSMEKVEFNTHLKISFVIGETYSWENEKGEKEQGELLSQKGDKLTFKIL